MPARLSRESNAEGRQRKSGKIRKLSTLINIFISVIIKSILCHRKLSSAGSSEILVGLGRKGCGGEKILSAIQRITKSFPAIAVKD